MEQYPNTGQNPSEQPQPGNAGQYPNTGQNPYGQPQYPNTGQNPYGQPQPSYPGQYPASGQNPYGQPQYPATGQNPYGQPQYPPTGQPQPGYPPTGQNPYGQPQPGYPGTGQPPTGGYGAPPTLAPTPTPSRNNSRVIAAVVVIAVVALLVVGSIIHVNSATGTVKGFYNDLFSFNYDSAFARICADKQSAVKADFDSAKTALDQLKSQASFDTSKLIYTLKSGGITSAIVTVSGSISATASGVTNSSPVPSTDIALKASGLGWCLDILPNTGTSSGS